MLLKNRELRKARKGWLGPTRCAFSGGVAWVCHYIGDELPVPSHAGGRLEGLPLSIIGDYEHHLVLSVATGSAAGWRHLVIPKDEVVRLDVVEVADIPWQGAPPKVSAGTAVVTGVLFGARGLGHEARRAEALMEGTAICLAYQRDGYEHSVYLAFKRRDDQQKVLEYLAEVLAPFSSARGRAPRGSG